MIDWNAPLEAVHTDGRVVTVSLATDVQDSDIDGDYATNEIMDDGSNVYHADGTNYSGSPWSLRNAVEQPAWRTSAEQLDRMNALVERIANGKVDKSQTPLSVAINTEIVSEARAILAAREPVDPRFDKVLGVLQQNERWLMPEDAARRFVRDVLAALDA